MKKFVIVSALLISSLLYADAYKEESKKIESDKKMIAAVEKKLTSDEKACDAPSQNYDKSVVTELKIYCESRESAKARIPDLKALLADYESAFKSYHESCRTVDNDETYSLCEGLDQKVVAAAELLNDEKEKFNSDLDSMENAAKKAKELNDRSKDLNQKEFTQAVASNLRSKKELVTAMKQGLENDAEAFKKSKIQLTQALATKSGESAAKGKSFLDSLNRIMLQNNNLKLVCNSMLRSIDSANEVCVKKNDFQKCEAAEKKMENLFNDGNAKLAVYKDEKSNVVALENDYFKAGMGDILAKMENAQRTISGNLQSLKSQSASLKQNIEMSSNNKEVVKSRNNKKMLDTFLGYLSAMDELEKENAAFIAFYEEALKRIDTFKSACVQGKSEFTTECRIDGDKITEEVDSTTAKVMKYNDRLNKVYKDLGDFYNKFK